MSVSLSSGNRSDASHPPGADGSPLISSGQLLRHVQVSDPAMCRLIVQRYAGKQLALLRFVSYSAFIDSSHISAQTL
jgi:hypothetical protein